jgi:transcriptional regulator with XRE-family HTH domain
MSDLDAMLDQIRSNLVIRRHLLGLTQYELADRMGTTQGQVHALEKGRPGIKLTTYDRWAAALKSKINLTVEYLDEQ